MTKIKIALAIALVAGSASFGAAQAASGHLRSSQVRLQEQNTYVAPITHGAGRLPGAFYQQEQAGYPQSPPTGS